MKLYLDDLRNPKTKGWLIARDVDAALELLETGLVTEISLDHDLGENEKTGYQFVCAIEELVFHKKIPMPKWNVHSANPVGNQRMVKALERMDKLNSV